MPLNIRDIKRRQKSIGNIGQMAKAMELVSVTKMRRSQRVALSSRPYTKAALEVLRNIKQKTDILKSYFFSGNEINGTSGIVKNGQKMAILLITTDKGLCGGLNTNVFRKTEKLITDLNCGSLTSATFCESFDFIVIGKKGEEWCRRKNFNVIKSFNNFGDYADIQYTVPISEFIINIFLKRYSFDEKEKKYDKIFAVYTNFISALKQEAVSRLILPLNEKELQEIIDSIIPKSGKFSDEQKISDTFAGNKWDFEYKFEPKAEEILDGILYSLIEAEIYYIILENNASEHSARRMAMKNAYENSNEILRNLSLTYNKARQAGITQELTEIASGANI